MALTLLIFLLVRFTVSSLFSFDKQQLLGEHFMEDTDTPILLVIQGAAITSTSADRQLSTPP